MTAPFRPDRRRLATRLALAIVFACLLLLWLNANWANRSVHHVSRFNPQQIDLSNAAHVLDLCRQHGWPPYAQPAQRKVYDLIMVNTELDWLEIRLNTTYHHVDYFIIVESKKTFTNHDKPLVIKDNMARFAPYRDKVIYHELQIPEGFHSDRPNPSWAWEDLQRDATYKQVFPALRGAQAPIHGDVIIVADVDEIVRPETLVVLKSCSFPRRLTLRSHFYYYSFQYMHKGPQWPHPQATYYQGWRTILPVNLRNSDGGIQPLIGLEKGELWNAGWHCSTCFSTVSEVLTKLASFSHIWLNQEAYRDRDRIADRVRGGKDLWDREGQEYERIENNSDIPTALLGHPDKFSYLLNRDGPTAGFSDYPER
ncbi:glycosyltransferase family 17 protein [Durotheca rogersii]|uniref:glycosyltransferase family 17 protein n=1 Tax=Durotheca rogersii TaxID=419775 RepID=UPI002220B139|nr:glycosyltransferase family 17 protein [Durotheca rogersii]KAI5864971.1 glycosyltransferase family 17 protein [Durotheca rogersii]